MYGLPGIAALVLGLLLAGGAQADQWQRPDALAGRWYAAGATALARAVDGYMAPAGRPLPSGQVMALVTPHAGHAYSGQVAGAAWGLAGQINPAPRVVVLVGPSHHFPLEKPSVWPQGSYACPLGPLPVDPKLAARVDKALGGHFVRQAHLAEHCLEVQVPFIRRALPQASLVPVLIGRLTPDQAQRLGRALAKAVAGQPVLLVASTDLSHFHSQARARELDARVAALVSACDPQGLMAGAAQGKLEACGLGALALVLHAARELGATRGLVLDQATSARATGDTTRVVGYLAAALLGPDPAQGSSTESGLDSAQCQRLRRLAQAAVIAAVRHRDPPPAPEDDPALNRPLGVFVTLKSQGRLRGCLGYLTGTTPLARAVVRMAQAAALQDPRFHPVRAEELPDLELEISVLSPLKPVDPGQVQVGRDGLLIEGGGRQGVLLPQVPLEQGWNREQYLTGLCRKAGMVPDCWRQPRVRLYRFSAQVF